MGYGVRSRLFGDRDPLAGVLRKRQGAPSIQKYTFFFYQWASERTSDQKSWHL